MGHMQLDLCADTILNHRRLESLYVNENIFRLTDMETWKHLKLADYATYTAPTVLRPGWFLPRDKFGLGLSRRQKAFYC